MAEPHLVVADGGLSSTVQDLGRYGYRRFGVSVSGALDPVSMRTANILVGNQPGEATIEMTLVGIQLVVHAPRCRVAVAGGSFPLHVNDEAADLFRAHDLRCGDEVRVGTARAGMRAYLAVSGGFDIAPVLGSRSTHVRSRLGGLDGAPLSAGDMVPLRTPEPVPGPLRSLPLEHRPRFDGPIHVLPGPQDDAFTEAGLASFLSGPYVVSDRSDRMGCQLHGDRIEHAGGFNIVSDPVVPGSVQVPGNGQPIVLLADCQTTGGYPKIATVISADLFRLGQRRPGDAVEFRPVDDRQALERSLDLRRHVETLPARLVDVPPLRMRPSTGVLLSRNLIGGVV
jgi:biotin-dependent carboxylase-like uncharacterized protein